MEDDAELADTIELPYRDFLNESKVSDETFATYLKQFEYDKSPLDPVVEWVREEEDWIREKITFNAAYGGERMIAYLFLPKQGTPPYQTVVFYPGISAVYFHSSEDLAIPLSVAWGPGTRDFLQKSGRAVLYPVFKSTFERGDDYNAASPVDGHFYREHVVMWVKDLSRSIDYLETRGDIDAGRIAYFGNSWGGNLGGIMAAVEKRIKASVLLVAGFEFYPYLPEADPVHYLPRIETPVLMLNGKYDFFFPYLTSQLPYFELIGTRNADKKMFVSETSHIVLMTDAIRETLDWLDRYLGPVE